MLASLFRNRFETREGTQRTHVVNFMAIKRFERIPVKGARR